MLACIVLSVKGGKSLTKEYIASMASTIDRPASLIVVDGAEQFLDKVLREDMRFDGKLNFRYTKLIRSVGLPDEARRDVGAKEAFALAESDNENACIIWPTLRPYLSKGWLSRMTDRLEEFPYKILMNDTDGLTGVSYIMAKKLLKEGQAIYSTVLFDRIAGMGGAFGIDKI